MFEGFVSEILRMVKSLGRKVLFFQRLGATKIPTIFKLYLYIHAVTLINFPEQFEFLVMLVL